MEHLLIDEFYNAIERWVEITKQDSANVTFYAMIHLGAVWFIRPEGAVKNSRSPEHRSKTVGEVMGKYTVVQLRDYLIHLVDDQKMYEEFLIAGLVQSIERELSELVLDYDDGINKTTEEALRLQEIYDHPEKHKEFLELYQETLTRKLGEEQDARQSILHVTNGMWKMSHRKPDDLAQRQSMLAAWKSVVAPVIARENLNQWRKAYMDSLRQ
jgi:hypothetical protein